MHLFDWKTAYTVRIEIGLKDIHAGSPDRVSVTFRFRSWKDNQLCRQPNGESRYDSHGLECVH